MKAIKFFRKGLDGVYKPLYASAEKNDYHEDHPNFNSRLGVEQEFIPDEVNPDRVREAFSTLALRDPTSAKLFRELLEYAQKVSGVPTAVEVADEVDMPGFGRDAPSERLFKKIKPLEELTPPEIHKYTKDDIKHFQAVRRELPFVKQYDAEGMKQYLRQLEQEPDDPNDNWVPEMIAHIKNRLQEYADKRQELITAYKHLRSKGYLPRDVQRAINIWREHLDNPIPIGFEKRDGFRDLFVHHPEDYETIKKYIAELEEDKEYCSDMTSKNLVDNRRTL